MALTDSNVLICDDIVDIGLSAHNCALHEDAVLDLSALADSDAPEHYGILDLALDDAAVSDKGVVHLAVEIILNGSIVAHLGIDSSLGQEQLLGVLGIQQLLVGFKIGSNAGDLAEIVGSHIPMLPWKQLTAACMSWGA